MKTKLLLLFFTCSMLHMFGNTVITRYGYKTTVRKNGFIYEMTAFEKDSLSLDEKKNSQIPFYRITGFGMATAIRADDSIPTEKALKAYASGGNVILHESEQHFPDQLSSWHGFKHAMKAITSYGYYDKSCNCIQSFQKHESGWDRNWASIIVAIILFFYGFFALIVMVEIWFQKETRFLVRWAGVGAVFIAITGGLAVYCLHMGTIMLQNLAMGGSSMVTLYVIIKWFNDYLFKDSLLPRWLNALFVSIPTISGFVVIYLQSSLVQACIWSIGPSLAGPVIMVITGGAITFANRIKNKKALFSA